MKLKTGIVQPPTPIARIQEAPTPPEIARLFADDDDDRILRSRRSLQLSVGIELINVIKLVAMILNMSFSLIIREIIRPYLNVGIKILKDAEILNEYGNITESIESTRQNMKHSERIALVRLFVNECHAQKLDTTWIDKKSL